MKLKLSQRIAISYYRAKIKTISLLSKKLAAEKALTIFCTPFSGKPKRAIPHLFHQAEKLVCHTNNLKLVGWQWNAKNSNGKKVLIAHGFDSCSYKFDKLIQHLLSAGFTVLAFDAPAHGLSDGKTVNALDYKKALLAINKQVEDLYCIIGHSLGGLAASLAAEEMHELKKLILIAPATETQRAIDNFFKYVPLGKDIKDEIEKIIYNFEQKPVSYYAVSRSVQTITIPVFWVHDSHDWICPFEDVKPIVDLHLNHIQFYISNGLGHNKIYRNNTVMQKITDFLIH
ncbi:MAG TPA: alpha/beta hydrolase [Chitinophagaceae bacterium]|nr:alpha/beta hydrolase [Chitinophagaceae bacterium]MCC6634452.1 alpha/beta hydrolase [Chitinophagaceae bacterium]HNF29006.1 alpha/beta hydrolase [Chitinophagaceae bacterium]HNM35193.1 alpha/beta hydrolase [Chitinophagaceae bacterium]HNN30502.1 alpha/beta hydrolase [Chitinophagaceae bacterium]